MESAQVPHPGKILLEEFLSPLGISRYRLAKETFMDITRISEIVRGERGITADAALRLSEFFGNSPEFWMNLQTQYELGLKKQELAKELVQIKRHTKEDRVAYADRAYPSSIDIPYDAATS